MIEWRNRARRFVRTKPARGSEWEIAPPRPEPSEFGVTDGARTHDNRSHSPGLYQLSYGHHERMGIGRGREI